MKKNSPRLLLLGETSFAIDAQHDKRRSLQDWYSGCNWTIPRGTSLATCFFCSACRSTRNPQQTKRVRSLRKEKRKNNLPKKNSPRLLLLADLSCCASIRNDKSASNNSLGEFFFVKSFSFSLFSHRANAFRLVGIACRKTCRSAEAGCKTCVL